MGRQREAADSVAETPAPPASSMLAQPGKTGSDCALSSANGLNPSKTGGSSSSPGYRAMSALGGGKQRVAFVRETFEILPRQARSGEFPQRRFEPRSASADKIRGKRQ